MKNMRIWHANISGFDSETVTPTVRHSKAMPASSQRKPGLYPDLLGHSEIKTTEITKTDTSLKRQALEKEKTLNQQIQYQHGRTMMI
ncbi:MAG: hypothetical protein ACLRXC_12425 [[Clostridium] leptum]